MSTEAFAEFEKAIARTLERRDLKGLKTIQRDFFEWAKDLGSDDVANLDSLLRAQFGRGLAEQGRSVSKAVDKILKRGRIASDDEYRLLMGRVDEIYADETRKSEVETINALLRARDSTKH